jgi:hypothetical protein
MPQGTSKQKLTLSIFSDRAQVQQQSKEDAEAAGFLIIEVDSLTEYCNLSERSFGNVVILDCPKTDDVVLAALETTDAYAARVGLALVVSTNVESLDNVFSCLEKSKPQILVNPTRVERLIALGQALTHRPTQHVRELSADDRLVLLQLTEQVSQIAKRMDTMSSPAAVAMIPVKNILAEAATPGSNRAFRFGSSPSSVTATIENSEAHLIQEAALLPDPRVIRHIIRQRQLRVRFFDGDLFADPAWDMLLDLTAARIEHSLVSVTSLCIASGVPPTTALRWIGQMTEAGLLQRIEDKTDRRRAFITLTEKAADAMSGLFSQLGETAIKII